MSVKSISYVKILFLFTAPTSRCQEYVQTSFASSARRPWRNQVFTGTFPVQRVLRGPNKNVAFAQQKSCQKMCWNMKMFASQTPPKKRGSFAPNVQDHSPISLVPGGTISGFIPTWRVSPSLNVSGNLLLSCLSFTYELMLQGEIYTRRGETGA